MGGVFGTRGGWLIVFIIITMHAVSVLHSHVCSVLSKTLPFNDHEQ